MVRMVCAVFCIALLLVSCQTKEAKVEQPEATAITVADFLTQAENYVDQNVTLTGTVSHVCAHGGKKMFVFADDQEKTVKVDAGVDVGSFPQELAGSQVSVKGIVRVMKVDEAYLNQWEEEVLAAAEGENVTEKENGTGVCAAEKQSSATVQAEEAAVEETAAEPATETAAEEQPEGDNESLNQINALRQQLADSGREYLGFYSIECISYEELHQ